MRKQFFYTLLLLALGVLAGCEEKEEPLYMMDDFPTKTNIEINADSLHFMQELSQIEGVIEKDPNISFEGSYYYVKVNRANTSLTHDYPEVLKIYPAFIDFSDDDLNKRIGISGNLYLTTGNPGELNMIAYIYVLNK